VAVRIFVDFDGTITNEDVGNSFFRTFGGPSCDRIVREYREGRISAVDCFLQEAAEVGSFNPDDARQFFRSQPIDESIHSLIEFSRNRGYEVTVLSDGLDLYLSEILGVNRLKHIPFYSNIAECVPDRAGSASLKLDFPHTDAECPRCACCKRNIMMTDCSDTDVIVLVGEGHSDTCPAAFADIVFAKSYLQTFCQRENISYFPYQSFHDVVDRLAGMSESGRGLKQGTRARLRRQELFRTE